MIFFFFLAIIEEELVGDNESSILSPRVRLNESTIVKSGYLDVFWGNDWERFYVEVNKQRIICRKEKVNKFQISFFFILLTCCSSFFHSVILVLYVIFL